MRPKILVTGANGYIASLVRLYNADAFDFTCVSHSDLDFSKTKDVADYFEKADFDIVFHTAANTTTADCERDPEGTHRINSESAIEIARICAMREKRMIFLSTEQLFNGKTQPGPLRKRPKSPCALPTMASRSLRLTRGSVQTSRTMLSSAFHGSLACPLPT